MATATLTSTQFTPPEHCGFTHVGFASDLGWSPGYWPKQVNIDWGNGQPCVLVELTADGALYFQQAGCIRLRIYND